MNGHANVERRQRISCSGRARRVLDHIDTQERRLRPEITLTLPLANWTFALLQYQQPMTTAEWDQMLRLLEVMKPGIVG